VAKRELTSIQDLLPSALASLARASGNARHLKPAWDRIVGPMISRQAWPVMLKGDVLFIEVASRQWARELADREAEIRSRLQPAFGKRLISKLVFRARE
jgi:predicted nucleic acid-binding Zn ribbon protein